MHGGRNVRIRLKGINTVTKKLADGTVKKFHYHRATGTALKGAPGSPEFIKSFAAAEKAMGDHVAGTFNSRARAFTQSIEFEHELAPSTQAEYKRMLKKAEAEFGGMPLAALDDPRMRKDFLDWREQVEKISGNREADNRLSAISSMLSWAPLSVLQIFRSVVDDPV